MKKTTKKLFFPILVTVAAGMLFTLFDSGCNKTPVAAPTPIPKQLAISDSPSPKAAVDPDSAQKATPKPGHMFDKNNKFPQLVGSWLTKYASRPHLNLDVAITDGSGSGVAKVVADLTGPHNTFRDIELTRATDTEWESEYGKRCDFVPDPPDGGIWWVSRVRATAVDGSWSEYYAKDPYGKYRYNAAGKSGEKLENQESRSWIGAAYQPEKTGPLFYLQTFGDPKNKDLHLIMKVYAEKDVERWIAINEEPDPYDFFPKIAMPLKSGAKYFIQVLSYDIKFGSYSILISDTGFTGAAHAISTDPDSYESNNDPAHATPIKLGEVQHHSAGQGLSTNIESDWFAFTVP